MDKDILERLLTRDPARLYQWIESTNERNSEYFPLCEDLDKRRDVMALCLLFAEKKIEVDAFISNVLAFDLFNNLDLQLGEVLDKNWIDPAWLNLPRVNEETLKEVRQVPGWSAPFKNIN